MIQIPKQYLVNTIDELNDMIQIPKQYLVNTIDELIQRVFPGLEGGYAEVFCLSSCNTYSNK